MGAKAPALREDGDIPVMSDYYDGIGGEIDRLSDSSEIPVDPDWRPSDDFVICRDVDGKPTAIYGGASWDLNPLRLGTKHIRIIRFDNVFESNCAGSDLLIGEIRYLLFCILFYACSGMLGRLSASVVVQYASALRLAALFCYSQKSNPLIGMISLGQLFSTPAYLKLYKTWMDANNPPVVIRQYTRRSILRLADIGESRVGFPIKSAFADEFSGKKEKHNQTPIIPTRIYVGVINNSDDLLNLLHLNKNRLENLIEWFQDPCYGCSEAQQIKDFGVKVSSLRPTLEEAINIHGLGSVLTGDYQPRGIGSAGYRSGLGAVLMRIQFALKNIIHLYTGMRDDEVLRLPYDCIDSEILISSTSDEEGVVRDSAVMVSVISTTTKFSGYRKETAWLATETVIYAVEVAQAICRGLSRVYGVDYQKLPLFLHPSVINSPNFKVKVSRFEKLSGYSSFGDFSLLAADLAELEASDPSRNFSEEKFQIGATWRFTSHQFRRSLAFYGSSSGFISLPSLRKQFKHLTTQMTRYYANNFDKLKTIFGYYDEDKQEFILPKNHFLFEYQTGVPLNIAYDLLDHAFGDGSVLFGGVGTYISNQRKKMGSGDIHIAELRSETEKQAKEGKIAYRDTLLGGCTTVGKCESYLLGNAVTCLSCDEGIIEKEKLESAIADDEGLLEQLEPGTGEYQVVESELNGFRKFHQKFISVKAVD